MKLRYNYRFCPNGRQVRQLSQLFGCCRVVWNDSLAFCRASEKLPKSSDLQKRFITQAKKTEERAWLADVSNIPLQQSIADLGFAFTNYFKSLKGKREGPRVHRPRFKKRSNQQSARFRRGGFSLKGNKVYLAKIGQVKVIWSRPLPAEPSSVTVTKEPSGRYFLSFVVEVEPMLLPENQKSIGIDLGIETFATLSDGEKVKAPKPLKRSLKKLGRLQRALSRCKKGSNRRQVARLKVAKLHAKIADIRSDFLHKLSSRLIFENQEINLEDLNVSGMMKNRKLSKAISDLGWRQFRTLLESKAVMYGRKVNVIDRWEPSSQVCSACGFRGGKKALDVRAWKCINCGAEHDRDINAAINIREAGGRSDSINGQRRKRKTSPVLAISDDASIPSGVPVQLSLRLG